MWKLIVLSLISFVSCSNDKTSVGKQDFLTDTIRRNKPAQMIAGENMHGYKPLGDKRELKGVWTNDNEEPLTLDITEDSIYYTDHFESYRYRVRDDSIFISYPDFEFSGRVYFHLDTMIVESTFEKAKYYRVDE